MGYKSHNILEVVAWHFNITSIELNYGATQAKYPAKYPGMYPAKYTS